MDWLTIVMVPYLVGMAFHLGWVMGRRRLRERHTNAAAQGGL